MNPRLPRFYFAPRSLRRLNLALVAGLAFRLFGCSAGESSKPADVPDPKAVVARYSGGEILRQDIAAALARQLERVPAPASLEVRRVAVRKAIERRVRIAELRSEAMAAGFLARPETGYLQRRAEDRFLAAELVARETASARAADALVAEQTDRRIQSLHPEEARKFSHIFLRVPEGDAAARSAAETRMREIQAALKAGTGFNELAERYSDSVMARGGGRIEWTQKRNLNPGVADAVFTLGEGEVSPVVSTSDGLHLFRLDGDRTASPIDVEATRRSVRSELDAEARRAAEESMRQRALDEAQVTFASPAQLASAMEGMELPVARFGSESVSAAEFRSAVGPSRNQGGSPGAQLRTLVEDRLLAARLRTAGLTPAQERGVSEASDQAALDDYRSSLISQLDTQATAEEVQRFYDENRESALMLREFHLDVLYFPQHGNDVADVYAAGERVGAALRAGRTFDQVLQDPGRKDAKAFREVVVNDIEGLSRRAARVSKAVLNLSPGEISPVIYLESAAVVEVAKCVLENKGVAFIRLNATGPAPLERVRKAILEALARQKESAGIEAIQQRLIAKSHLEILLPEG
ncbi:MAG: peptidylprolyl isomerase [Thermoanaerobaculia bacterium]